MHIWPLPMVCNDIPCDIPERHPPLMYFVRIDPSDSEPRANALGNNPRGLSTTGIMCEFPKTMKLVSRNVGVQKSLFPLGLLPIL